MKERNGLKFTRRGFVMASAAAVAVRPSMSPAASPVSALVTDETDVQLLPEGYDRTSVWTYNGQTHGPEIRVAQGSRIRQNLNNRLAQSTTVHWHGIRIDNAMDGVPDLTQNAVATGQSFDYDFVVPDAGTFWYHAHKNSVEQVARGLYGPLIVEEPDPIDIDQEEVLILDDWLVDPESAQIDPNFDAGHNLSHAGRMGNYMTTNSKYNLQLDVQQNQRLRLRIINASNARIFTLGLEGLKGWTIALDGMGLELPTPVGDAFVVGPAQRVDLIVDVIADVGSLAHIVNFDRNQAFSQVAFAVGDGDRALRTNVPEPLPANPVSSVDLGSTTQVTLKMEGGAMSGLRSGMLGGIEMDMGELVKEGRFWTFNGAADGMEGAPLASVKLGQHVRLAIENETAFPHAMHLHGMHFHEIDATGSLGPLRDTTMVERGATKEIAFVADNPGQWLFHCHMLSHAASGMSSRIVVS